MQTCNAQPCSITVMSCPSPVIAGETRTYRFVLTNTGTKTQSYRVEVYINDTLVGYAETPPLMAGAMQPIEFSVRWPAPGNYLIRVRGYTC